LNPDEVKILEIGAEFLGDDVTGEDWVANWWNPASAGFLFVRRLLRSRT
jgi:hypothetical protein